MIQLKELYNIYFPKDRCKLITADENEVSTFHGLMRIAINNKLECLQFIPEEVLQSLFMEKPAIV